VVANAPGQPTTPGAPDARPETTASRTYRTATNGGVAEHGQVIEGKNEVNTAAKKKFAAVSQKRLAATLYK
jgi:hypothetical protein